jgi:hypothetical protein
MDTLNYPRHFFLLGCGSVALVLLLRLPTALPYDRLYFLCGLSGALHAIAVVLALRSQASRLSRFGFVVATAALSIAAPFAALQLIELLGLRGIATIFVALALTSAIGAVSYWLLVRVLWARFLSPRSLLVTVGSCLLATFIATVAISVASSLRDVLLPMLWWLAFSASLLMADRHNMAANPYEASSCQDVAGKPRMGASLGSTLFR